MDSLTHSEDADLLLGGVGTVHDVHLVLHLPVPGEGGLEIGAGQQSLEEFY